MASALALALAFSLVFAPVAQAQPVAQARLMAVEETQVGRYTTQPAAPAPDIDQPLRAVVRISYPRGLVISIGDALGHTLMRSGYRLETPSQLSPQARDFLQLPLPESQRVLGPYRVHAVLQTLLGPAWRLERDETTRTVRFVEATN